MSSALVHNSLSHGKLATCVPLSVPKDDDLEEGTDVKKFVEATEPRITHHGLNVPPVNTMIARKSNVTPLSPK